MIDNDLHLGTIKTNTIWQHIVYVQNGINNILYVDGVKSLEWNNNTINNKFNNITLGYNSDDAIYFYGYIDDTRLYKIT